MFEQSSFITTDPVTAYIGEHSLRLSEVEKDLIKATMKHPQSRMMGSPECLHMNANLMRTIQATKVLDIGTFTGLSALSSALAIPSDGIIFTLDITDKYLQIAKHFWTQAGVDHKIEPIIGRSVETLDTILSEGNSGTFDFAFIDGDHNSMCEDYDRCIELVRPGGIISVDNTLWGGSVLNSDDRSRDTEAVRTFNRHLKDDDRVHISFLPMGDGLTLCFKK